MPEGNMVYIPQDINVQMPASQEHPGGRVLQLKQGWTPQTDEMRSHPVLSKLRSYDLPGEADRRDQLRRAEETYNETVGKAAAELSETRAKIAADRAKEMAKADEDWSSRANEAAARGLAFNEPHPHPETQRAMALTAGPAAHATIPSEAFAQRPLVAEDREKMRESTPSEAENRERMEAASEEDRNKSSGDRHQQRRRTES